MICFRNGGHLCYGAIGDNSYYHSAMGGRLCYAVYPGDAATALIPFDARVRLATPAGVKELTVEQLVPGASMRRTNALPMNPAPPVTSSVGMKGASYDGNDVPGVTH